MARNFFVAPVPYIGNFTPKPISLCRPSDDEPSAVTLEIPWTLETSPGHSPYADGAVQVDLTVQGPANPLKKIRSMVIDNTAVDRAVFVKFPDTQDVITVLAGTVARVAVLTNSLQFNVFAASPFLVITSVVVLTRIVVTNVYLDPIVERENDTSIGQYLNSVSQDATTASYSPIGMADISIQNVKSLTTAGFITINASEGGSGFCMFRAIRIWCAGAYNTDVMKKVVVTLEFDLFPVITLIQPVGTDLVAYPRKLIFEKTGINWVVLPNILITLRNDVACSDGELEIEMDYTLTGVIPGYG